MIKVIKVMAAYALWIVDLGLGLWLVFFSRTAFLNILAQFYQPGNLRFGYVVGFYDKAFSIIVGLGWLAFSIFTESYFRAGALEPGLLKRFARVTGPVVLCIFIIDLILFWIQGIGTGGWLRWLILAAELGIGAALLVFANLKPAPKQN